MDAEPKFLVDKRLGKVARWLVLLGYDAAYPAEKNPSNASLLEQARAQDRIFLTRDAALPELTGVRKIVLHDQDFPYQLRAVLRILKIRPDRKKMFSRCAACNAPLEAISREQALPLVPPLVRELDTVFTRCPACNRVYWTGSHTEKTVKKLELMGL